VDADEGVAQAKHAGIAGFSADTYESMLEPESGIS
jgi:hypothetical protein